MNGMAALASRSESPWHLTLPVAAGVFLGALLFSLFALAYLHAQNRNVSFAGVSATASTTNSPGFGESLDAEEADASAALPRMPGLIEANRRRLRAACIAGTIGHRRSNGWVEAVADNAPRRCVATTQ
ncbi:MAG TPA: hypothetical protein VJ806_05805 [Luteimonas sp.]|nr:hypothetical protein [Luteimonas sp.]